MRLSQQRAEALNSIRSRSKAVSLFYPGLLLAAVAMTAIAKRYPDTVLGIGIWTVLAATIHAYGIFRSRNRWFIMGRIGLASGLGALGFLSLTGFELSWTTFFVLLMNLCAASIEVPTLAPVLSISVTVISLIVGPSMIASYASVGGGKGRALALFFTFFFGALVYQARTQRNEFVSALKTSSSLRKMADTLPI